MLTLVPALAILLVVLYAFRRRHQWGVPVDERPRLVQAITAALAALIAAGAALWLNHLANEPDSTLIAYLLTGAMCLGAVAYLVGILVGYGGVALRLRWVGWVLMAAALIIPSTFILALPIVLFLAVTLRPLPPRPPSDQPSADVVVPR